ncbi:Fimbrial protein domain-containing protein (plasmid) [Rahnella aceris]|uniref:Fimbrial protein domain-containing protein n=2 Tax=Rahnella sp. (strain Y9602) TaxID=2703885 RepID=A0A0H3FHM1_RAHSY|nr:Fimbrial protein domain-containing protein [Rahnella aceris]
MLLAITTLVLVHFTNAIAASEPVAINVTGKIVDNTCTVDTNGSDLNPILVGVSARDLKGVGTTLGKRDIKISLKDCGKDIDRGLVVTASGEPDTADESGYAFKNASTGESAASGVGLQFYKSADRSTPFMTNGNVTETISNLKEGDNTLTFAAAYVAIIAEPSAGDFSTTVNLKLDYQ